MIGASWDGISTPRRCAPHPSTWRVTKYEIPAPASGTRGATGDRKMTPTRTAITSTVTISSTTNAFSIRLPSLI